MKKGFLLFLSCMFISLGNAQQFDTTAYKTAYKAMFEKTAFGDSWTTETKIAGLSSAWAEAKFNFANFDLIPTVNWDSIYRAYIPKAIAAQTKKEYYDVLQQFYVNLNDGHSGIIVPRDLWDEVYAYVPIRAKLIENKVVVSALNSDNKEYELLKPGTVIHKINGVHVQDYVSENIAPYISSSTSHDLGARLYSFFFTRGNIMEPVVLEIETLQGRKITQSFKRVSRDEPFPAAKGFSYKKLDKDTGLLTVNTFMDPEVVKLYDSIFQNPHPKNLIIDLRENGGGNGNNGFELIGYLTKEPFAMSRQVMRQYNPAQRAWGGEPDRLDIGKYNWNPYKEQTFKGKVVVLAGPDTYSAAEDFLSSFKHLRRGTVVGQTTGGSTGQPLFYPLPFGGMGVVCAKRDVLPDWKEFIGIGIRPDVEVKPTLKAYLAGKDEAMETAIKLLKS